MGAGASATLKEAATAAPDDLNFALAWKETVLDSIVILGDYAIMGASALGNRAMELAVPFSEKGDKKLACIVDSGQPELWFRKLAPELGGSLEGKTIDTWIILMPSIDSDPCWRGSSLMLSMVIAGIVCTAAAETSQESADIRLVHRDFYFANPIGSAFEWIPGFLAKDAKILPGSKQESMKAWYTSWMELVMPRREGVHHATMRGYDEMGISEGLEILEKCLKESKPADDSDYQGPSSMLMLTITPESSPDADRVKVACTNVAGDTVCSNDFKQSDTLAEFDLFFRERVPESGPLSFWQGSDKVQVDSKISSYKELTATRPLSTLSLAELVQFPQACVRLAVGECHGLAKEFSLEEFKFDADKASKWRKAGADILLLADLESLSLEFDRDLIKLREAIPGTCLHGVALTLVVIAKDFASFKHPNFTQRIHQAVSETNVCVFATLEDIDKVKSVYLKAPLYPNGTCVCQAMEPYPRLHFFCLLGRDGKTCGRDVRDGSLLFTSLKFGSDGPTLPAEKLGPSQCVVGPDGPIHFVTVSGASEATLVTPYFVLKDILRMAIQAGCTEGEDYEREDALENVQALRSDYKMVYGEEQEGQESDCEAAAEKTAEAPEAAGEPDGSLESAQKYLQYLGRKAVKEVSGFGRPPPAILLPCKACAVLLDVEVRTEDEWKDYQKMMQNAHEFIKQMLSIRPDSISQEQLAKLRAITSQEDFTFEIQKRISAIGAALTALTLALLKGAE